MSRPASEETRAAADADHSGARVVVITGAGAGIGRAYCAALAADGWLVAALDRDRDAVEETAGAISSGGRTCASFVADVTDDAALRTAVAAIRAELGPVTALVNNAALITSLPRRGWEEIDVGEWDAVMAVNLKGMFLATRAVIADMKAARYGKSVNGLTLSANQIANSDADYLDKTAIQGRALPRAQLPADLIGAVGFLLSPGSDYITGQTLIVDGGKAMI